MIRIYKTRCCGPETILGCDKFARWESEWCTTLEGAHALRDQHVNKTGHERFRDVASFALQNEDLQEIHLLPPPWESGGL